MAPNVLSQTAIEDVRLIKEPDCGAAVAGRSTANCSEVRHLEKCAQSDSCLRFHTVRIPHAIFDLPQGCGQVRDQSRAYEFIWHEC